MYKFNATPKKDKSIFPIKIGEYKFIKEFNIDNSISFFHFGLYNDESGKMYVCKLWFGKRHNLKYKWINNEIDSYQLLHNIYSRNKKKIDELFPNINIPNIYFISKEKNKVYFLMDKVEGDSLSAKSNKVILDSYIVIYSYLKMLTKHLMNKEIAIVKRSAINYFTLFHYFLILASIKYPELIFTLFKSMPFVYRGFYQMLHSKENVLVLRDLASDNNIFINQKELSIIDLESLTYTNEVVQVASTVIVECSNQKFLDFFFNSDVVIKIIKNINTRNVFKAMLLYVSIVELVATYRTDTAIVKSEAMYVFNKALSL